MREGGRRDTKKNRITKITIFQLLIKIGEQVDRKNIIFVQFVAIASLNSIHSFLTRGIFNKEVATKYKTTLRTIISKGQSSKS